MNLPYKIIGGVRFYDRREVKDVLAILKLVVNGRDLVSLERVMKNVLSGIGEITIGKVITKASMMSTNRPAEDIRLLEAAKTAKAKTALIRLANFLKSVKPTDSPAEIVKSAVKKFDFSTLLDDGTPSTDERMQNLDVLANTASEYETLEDFLADAALMSSSDEKTSKNSVTLMTLHAAKGLEFPVVFIVGMEEGLFPSARGTETEAELEEERRLAYVGITRAMNKLFLTYAKRRNLYGSYNSSMPSRFLSELGYAEKPEPNSLPSHAGSLDYKDIDGDGFSDFSDDFGDTDFDPFPDDLPVYE